ncbi:MAG: alpha/beta hydrolase-fold protein [Deinococcales bacterium]
MEQCQALCRIYAPKSFANAIRWARYLEALADDYLKFMVLELKPFIDGHYSTDGKDFVMGSSMGALISLYALSEYPHIFKAACLSTHWPACQEKGLDYFATLVPQAGKHRLYFDYGTLGLDADYEPYQQKMDGHLRLKGYQLGKDWQSLKFVGADHNEISWRERLGGVLGFLIEP